MGGFANGTELSACKVRVPGTNNENVLKHLKVRNVWRERQRDPVGQQVHYVQIATEDRTIQSRLTRRPLTSVTCKETCSVYDSIFVRDHDVGIPKVD